MPKKVNDVTTLTTLLLEYQYNKHQYMDAIKYRNPIFNNENGITLKSGLHIKSPNLADDTAVYIFYYGGVYLFEIRLSTNTGTSIEVRYGCCYDPKFKNTCKMILVLESPYRDSYYGGHPNYIDDVFIPLYLKCMNAVFTTTELGKRIVIATQQLHNKNIELENKRKYELAYEKIKAFIEE